VVLQPLGDAVRPDHPQAEKYVPTAQAERVQPRDESMLVLSLGEVAARLGSRDQVVRIRAAGKMRALLTRYREMMPTSEVDQSA
jgi:hypothetical protein